MENRRFKRKTIVLEAELECKGKSHAVFVGNVSREGIFVITAPLKEAFEFTRGTRHQLLIKAPGKNINVSCVIRRSEKIHPKGLIWKIGLEITGHSQDYTEFLQEQGLDDTGLQSFVIPDSSET